MWAEFCGLDIILIHILFALWKKRKSAIFLDPEHKMAQQRNDSSGKFISQSQLCIWCHSDWLLRPMNCWNLPQITKTTWLILDVFHQTEFNLAECAGHSLGIDLLNTILMISNTQVVVPCCTQRTGRPLEWKRHGALIFFSWGLQPDRVEGRIESFSRNTSFCSQALFVYDSLSSSALLPNNVFF